MQGKTIRRRRIQLDLTQAELARRVKVSAALVSGWETGRSAPSEANIAALRAVFANDGADGEETGQSKVDMPWQDAIAAVLRSSAEPLHYSDIAQQIIDNGFRTNVGATPANTVAANLSSSISRLGSRSPFVKVERGLYTLRSAKSAPLKKSSEEADAAEATAREMGLINAFGMFWDRDWVKWRSTMPNLLGVQQLGSEPVNFTDQSGVYVLYDGSRVIYVGKAFDRRLGLRLYDHTRDRLTGRWNRFSWFGVRGVEPDGKLTNLPKAELGLGSLIATMEALLIEGLEPPQNRRQGDGFNAVEFMQAKDPEIEMDQHREAIARLTEDNL